MFFCLYCITLCNASIIENGLIYEIDSTSLNNEVVLKSSISDYFINNKIKSLIIPEKVKCNQKKYKVSVIGDMFFCPKEIENIELNCLVQSIPQHTFERCIKLKKIKLPNSLREIKPLSFRECVNLKEISIPSNVKKIGYKAFENCSNLESISIPNIDSLQWGTFGGCEKLKHIKMSDSIKYIALDAFDGCHSLQSLRIPRFAYIDYKSFQGALKSLRRITTDSNEWVIAIKNVLLDKNNKTIIFYAPCKKDTLYTVPSGIKCVSQNAFCNAKNLHKIRFKGDTLHIKEFAFLECSNLREIEFDNDIVYRDGFAFYMCDSMKEVHSSGKISFNQPLENNCLLFYKNQEDKYVKCNLLDYINLRPKNFKWSTKLSKDSIKQYLYKIRYVNTEMYDNLSGDDCFWKIVCSGEDAIETLIESLKDSTISNVKEIFSCKKSPLTISETAYILLCNIIVNLSSDYLSINDFIKRDKNDDLIKMIKDVCDVKNLIWNHDFRQRHNKSIFFEYNSLYNPARGYYISIK